MRVNRRPILLAATILTIAGAATLPFQRGSAQDVTTLSAKIWSGTCFDTKDELFTLNDVARENGTGVRALPAYSESRVETGLDQLLADPAVIAVARSADGKTLVACGELHGVPTADGSVAIGLREMNGSVYGGIAVLNSDGASTTVRVYVAGGISSGPEVEAEEEESTVDDVVNVTVDESGIFADQTEFGVGMRIQFNVHNGGDQRHEVMLEPENANEEPLGDDGSQAETEDIAPEDDASFVVIISEAGAYQLADHIGESDFVLPITVS